MITLVSSKAKKPLCTLVDRFGRSAKGNERSRQGSRDKTDLPKQAQLSAVNRHRRRCVLCTWRAALRLCLGHTAAPAETSSHVWASDHEQTKAVPRRAQRAFGSICSVGLCVRAAACQAVCMRHASHQNLAAEALLGRHEDHAHAMVPGRLPLPGVRRTRQISLGHQSQHSG